jgi:hypothetical protein
MKKVAIIPANEKLMREYYGNCPLPTMRAFFLMEDDQPIGVFGFIRLPNGRRLAVSESKVVLRERHKLSVMKFARLMLKYADSKGWVLVAFPDETIERAPNFLKHFGFVPNEDGGYIRWHGQQQQRRMSPQA